MLPISTATAEDALQGGFVKARTSHPAPAVTTPVQSPIVCEGNITYPTLTNTDVSYTLSSTSLDTKYVDHAIMTFDSNGGTWSFENCSLSIPEGAIPKEKIIAVEIGVSICTQLTALLPLGLRSVSPIIQLCLLNEPKFKFTKPVMIQIEHFLHISHRSDVKSMNLHFLKSSHGLPCFHTTDGVEEFTAGTHHGTLTIDHFCSFCIAADITSIDACKVYYYVISVIPKHVIVPKWEIVYCIALYTCSRVRT
jgi:hypothetical protein